MIVTRMSVKLTVNLSVAEHYALRALWAKQRSIRHLMLRAVVLTTFHNMCVHIFKDVKYCQHDIISFWCIQYRTAVTMVTMTSVNKSACVTGTGAEPTVKTPQVMITCINVCAYLFVLYDILA